MALTLILNGTLRHFEELPLNATILNLIDVLGLKSDRIALEHNGNIAPRASWSHQIIAEGDKIELVHFVGGGTNTSCSD
jgi:sulfur carrier protein